LRYSVVILLVFLGVAGKICAQQIPPVNTLDSVVVEVTRTNKTLGQIPAPIQVITKKQIQKTGAQKLIDVLQQQPGIIIADNPLGQSLQGYPNPFGSGVQMQGLDPAYTQILVDGEPLTGRNAGILNLGRIALGNVKQIEILKGPATSLYGSESLAGAINIVTETATKNATSAQLHYGSNSTNVINLTQSFVAKNIIITGFASRYQTAGYDLDKTIFGKTIDPYTNYNFSTKINWNITKKWSLQQSLRYFDQTQKNQYQVSVNANPEIVAGTTAEKDWSSNTQLSFLPHKKTKLFARLYATGYKNNAAVFTQSTNLLFDNTYLTQTLIKPELQAEFGLSKKLITGAGAIIQNINSSRYANKQQLNGSYIFAQKEWILKNKLNITAGFRLDKQQQFKTQFNPKLAAGYQINKKIAISGSVGRGFKTPDFRQLYLNFTNASIGYALIGANELPATLIQMQQQGQIATSTNITPFTNANTLNAENSWGSNFSVKVKPTNKLNIDADFFRNDINQLIEVFILPFSNINGSNIYSYRNIAAVFTQGINTQIKYQLNKNLSVIGGYQYLEAKDKQVLKDIEDKKIIGRDPETFVSRYTTKNNYGGLFNRSKHSGTLQLNYDNLPNNLSANLRVIMRNRFGFSDVNGNAILDDDREYAKGYTLLNFAITKTIHKKIDIQLGCDNILGFTNPTQLPNFFGRNFFTNINIQF
jgi:outer membrane receptor for ferrienterochelin and colicins